MASDQTALIVGGGILAAFWAGTNAVIAGAKHTNEVRDRIVIGKIGSDALPEAHAWRLLWVDWLPMKIGLAFVSLMLGVIIILLPQLAGVEPTRWDFLAACYVASVVPFAGFLTFIVSGAVEFRFMRNVIRRRGAAQGAHKTV